MDTDPQWLREDEQRVWRRWLTMTTELDAALNRELQQDSGLSLQDFGVLVYLTDAADGRLRMTELAGVLQWERSRVSHHVKRMEGRGLLERAQCPEDRRGSFVVLTPKGRAAIEQAAPGHVRAVRDLVFDALTPGEMAALGSIATKVLGRIAERAAD